MQSLIVISVVIATCLADLPAIHEKPVNINVPNGGKLTLKIPSPTNIWHRKFTTSNLPEQYVETCNPYLDVCEKWRSGFLGKDVHDIKVSIGKDGTLTMPKVTAADSAQYYTYYRANDGVHHYSYFNVVVGNARG